ncbi:MAG: AAA family ATPase [Patescibacteria group bacterium]|nr:AAA family ATPase [Patescibacteria group bacterium]
MPDKKIIIGLAGKIAAGKGTVALYLKNNYNANTYRFSTMLRDILERLHLEVNRFNMQSMSECLRQKFGEDLLAKAMANDIKSDPGKLLVIDGVRRLDDIKYLQELPGFKLIRIETDPEIRYQRLIARSENQDDQEKTYEEFMKDEQGEAELEIPKVMEHAQLAINNNSTLEELYRQIDELIKK